MFCSLLWFKIRGRDLRIFISQGKSREGRKEGERGAIVMTLSENKCPSFHSLGQGIFLSVSSISCQHGSLRGADAEVGEKCSLSRLFREPSHDGLVLPATFPQDALTTCQRAIWHLHPGAGQSARSSTGRSSFLPQLRYRGAEAARPTQKATFS